MKATHRLRTLVLSAALALSTQVSAATFNDSFSSGLNATYWTVTEFHPGVAASLYSVTTPSGQVHLERKPGFIGSGLQYVACLLYTSRCV